MAIWSITPLKKCPIVKHTEILTAKFAACDGDSARIITEITIATVEIAAAAQ
jgi:hypothetical protein